MFSSESVQEHILYDKIYQYLWVKSETSSPPSILIPDTVIIIRSMPIYWYYTDKETGEIKKKTRKNITKENIKDTWISKMGRSSVVAYLLHFVDNLDLNFPPEKLELGGQIQIIYLDEPGFRQFMDGNIELPFAILQRFVEPADDRNSQIQAYWSKSVTLFTKRVCKKQFTNKSMDIYEKHCTFEGPEYFSEATQVKDFQSQRISEQIDKMINHLDNISYGKLNISQGTFYFKVDKKARCWFLFCGNLKFEDDRTLKNVPKELYTHSLIKIPKTVDNLMSVYRARPLQLNRQNKCIRCSKIEKSANFNEVPYQYLIDFKDKPIPPSEWPAEIRKNAKEVKLSGISSQKTYLNTVTQIPLTFQKIHEKLNQQNYEQLKECQGFKYKNVQVCLDCYIELVSNQERITKQSITSKINPTILIAGNTKQKKPTFQRSQCSFFKSSKKVQDILRPSSEEKTQQSSNKVNNNNNNNNNNTNNNKNNNIYLPYKQKDNAIIQYINQRLSECNTITPQKYSIEQPSTADYLSRKTKSTYLDIQSNSAHAKLKYSRETYNQSLQEKKKFKPIDEKVE